MSPAYMSPAFARFRVETSKESERKDGEDV